MMQTGFFKKETIGYCSDKDICIDGRNTASSQNKPCVGPIVDVTPFLNSCIDSCSPGSGYDAAVFYAHDVWTCTEAWNSGTTQSCYMNCMYFNNPVFDCWDLDDGGINYNLKGETYNNYGFTMEDTCNGNILSEYYCDGSNYIQRDEYSCTGGTECINGACIIPSTYSDFTSFKSSYLSGGSLSAFISNANTWVV